MLLLLAGSVDDGDKDAINIKYPVSIFSEDWDFYFTATTNLGRIKEATAGVRALSDEQRMVIAEKADQILASIEAAPKSGKWKGRAKVGTKNPWYKGVSDWE